MQSAAALLASAPKVSSSVPVTPGASRPIYLTDAQSAELAFRRANGLGRRYLNLFPRRYQVLAGTLTTIGVGAGLFFALRPAPNVNAPDNLTRTAEWIKAEKEYLEKQRISPAHKKSG